MTDSPALQPLHPDTSGFRRSQTAETVWNTSNASPQNLSNQRRNQFMSHFPLNTLVLSLQVLPVALVLTRQLLLPENCLVSVESGAASAKRKLLTFGTTKITTLLKDFGGHTHFGINE
jgi:hypothetical protein